jgi:hypothetical protein
MFLSCTLYFFLFLKCETSTYSEPALFPERILNLGSIDEQARNSKESEG